MQHKVFLLLCYSVSQSRLFKAFLAEIPASVPVTVMSFNDDEKVNAQIREEFSDLHDTFVSTFADLVTQTNPQKGHTDQIDGLISYDHPYTDMLKRQSQTARQYLDELKPDMVLVNEDGSGGCDPFIKAANQAGIPVVIVPFGVGEARDYEIFIDQKYEEGMLNTIPDGPVGEALLQHAPNWIRQTPHGDITLFPVEFILARLANGLNLR